MLSPVSTNQDSSTRGHLAFLRRIASDEEFRSAVEADPKTHLAEYGLDIDSDRLPHEVALPAGHALSDFLEDLGESGDPDRDIAWQGWVGG